MNSHDHIDIERVKENFLNDKDRFLINAIIDFLTEAETIT